MKTTTVRRDLPVAGKSLFFVLSILLFLALFTGSVFAQVTLPVASPYATVSERVGITDITITYGRPGVNDRAIWGGLVPYGHSNPFPNFGSGNPFPWRGGANENTTITFADDVLIEGQALKAGTYGLHMIPGESEWVVIFSNNSTSWGSFFYNESEDALRVTVQPESALHKERLAYEFIGNDGQNHTTIAVRWEKMKVPFKVEVPHEVILANMRNELRSRAGFTWQGWSQAANYCLQNNINHEEALVWAEQAIQRNSNFNTLSIKAGLLTQQGKTAEADAIMDEAMKTATENQLNAYGYQLLGQSRMEDALRIFKLNVERHPDAWNPHDSLGDIYGRMEDTKNAIKYYKMALDKLPEGNANQQDRINKILAGLNAN